VRERGRERERVRARAREREREREMWNTNLFEFGVKFVILAIVFERADLGHLIHKCIRVEWMDHPVLRAHVWVWVVWVGGCVRACVCVCVRACAFCLCPCVCVLVLECVDVAC
jgi:hypothetical protein